MNEPKCPSPYVSKVRVIKNKLCEIEGYLDQVPKSGWGAKDRPDTFVGNGKCQKLIFGRTPNPMGKMMINATNNTRLTSSGQQSVLMKKIHELLVAVMTYADMDFKYSTIQVNKNSMTKIHKDSQNAGISYGCSMGDFTYDRDTKGDLVVYPHYASSRKVGDPEYINYRYSLQKFDARVHHTTNPKIKGDRYAVLFFKHNFADDTDCLLDMNFLRKSDYINQQMGDYKRYEKGLKVKHPENTERYVEIKMLRQARDDFIAPCFKLTSFENPDLIEKYVGEKMFWRYCDPPNEKKRKTKGSIKDWHWNNKYITSLMSAKLLARFVETHDYATYDDFLRKFKDKKTWGTNEKMPNLALTSERIAFKTKKVVCNGPSKISNKAVCDFADYLDTLDETEATDAVNYLQAKLRTRKYNWLLYYVCLLSQNENKKQLEKRQRMISPKGKVGKSVAKRKEQGGEPEEEKLSEDDKIYTERVMNTVMETSHVNIKDIKGLDSVIADMSQKIKLRLWQPHLLGNEHEAIGFLMYGPPGCGKTMVANALTSSIDMDATFFNIQSSNVTSKWIGEAEKFVEYLFKVARKQKYSIIFMDECENVFKDRSMRKEGSGSSILTQFMTEWNSPQNSNVLIIGATNRPDMIDGAIGRRFKSGHFYIPLPAPEARESLINHLLANNKGQRHDLSTEDLAAFVDVTEGFNCSDISIVVSELNTKVFSEIKFTDERLKGERIERSSFRPIVTADIYHVLSTYRSKVKHGDVLLCEEYMGSTETPKAKDDEEEEHYVDECAEVEDDDDGEDEEEWNALQEEKLELQIKNSKLEKEINRLNKDNNQLFEKVMEHDSTIFKLEATVKKLMKKKKKKAASPAKAVSSFPTAPEANAVVPSPVPKKIKIRRKLLSNSVWLKKTKVFVISLKENNEERREHMKTNLDSLGFTNWEFFDATTAVELSEIKAKDATWRYEGQSDDKKKLRKAACLVSHVRVLRHILFTNIDTPVIIMEDDVDFNHPMFKKHQIRLMADHKTTTQFYQFGWFPDEQDQRKLKDSLGKYKDAKVENGWIAYQEKQWAWCMTMCLIPNKDSLKVLLEKFAPYFPYDRNELLDKEVNGKIKNWTSDCILTKIICPAFDGNAFLLADSVKQMTFDSAIDLSDVRIMYLAKTGQLGGWRSFCVHLYRLLARQNVECIPYLHQLGQTQGKGNFGYSIEYKLKSMKTLVNHKNVIIGCVEKKQKDLLKQLKSHHCVVVHDPNELEYIDIDDLKRVKVITIRQSVHDLLKEKYGISSTFILHPFVPFAVETKQRTKIISTARCSARKQTNIILDANALYAKENNGEIGCELHCDVDPFFLRGDEKHPMFILSYKGKFDKTFEAMANVYADAIATVDMSIFKKKEKVVDGGGTQYTFLEAINCGCILILHKSWLTFASPFQDKQNCFVVADAEELADLMIDMKDPNKRMKKMLESIPVEAKRLLCRHDNVGEWLNLFSVKKTSPKKKAPARHFGPSKNNTRWNSIRDSPVKGRNSEWGVSAGAGWGGEGPSTTGTSGIEEDLGDMSLSSKE